MAGVAKGPPAGFTTLERPLANDVTRPPTRPVYFRSSPINYSAGFRSDLITVLTVSAFLSVFFSFYRGTHLYRATATSLDLERRGCGRIS